MKYYASSLYSGLVDVRLNYFRYLVNKKKKGYSFPSSESLFRSLARTRIVFYHTIFHYIHEGRIYNSFQQSELFQSIEPGMPFCALQYLVI